MSPEDKAKMEAWLETQRGRPQARAMRTAGWTANRLLRPLERKHGKGGGALALITRHWPDHAGRYAKLSKPIRVQGTKEGRTLVVEAVGPAATLIQADAGRILERINARHGANAIDALRVVQGRMERDTPIDASPSRGLTPTEEAQLQESLGAVEDERLKAALEKMGRNAISRDPSRKG